MAFQPRVKEDALVRSRRCCCVCNEFAGLYTNVHHIVPKSDGGSNNLDNAIVLCLRCHGEAGHYNAAHPMGNKYSPSELRRHRDNWWEWCEQNPGVPAPKNPIAVSPSIAKLSSREWITRTTLKVHNKSAQPYYAVYLKLAIQGHDVSAGDLKVSQLGGKRELVGSAGPVSVQWDAFVLLGLDESDQPAQYVVICSVDPGETVTLLLGPSATADTPLTVRIALAQFSVDPISVGQKGPDMTSVPISLPEQFLLQAKQVLLRRAE